MNTNRKRVFESEDGPKRVGKYYKSIGKQMTYSNVKFDKNRWADASMFLPLDFDMCYCKGEEKILPGWYTGTCWDGLQIEPNFRVLFWKNNYDN